MVLCNRLSLEISCFFSTYIRNRHGSYKTRISSPPPPATHHLRILNRRRYSYSEATQEVVKEVHQDSSKNIFITDKPIYRQWRYYGPPGKIMMSDTLQ
ncbi:homeobox protein Hox-B9 isoform X4 [Lepidochelys kempii]|uniref:homeobox protein Hox-B9 isoform X4 n=1 Tax=Lepidochelys kempii TaxID=8472 RepID=UPI003C6EF504